MDLPYDIYYHASVASDQGVITCGGRGADGSSQSKCSLLTPNGRTKSFPSLVGERQNHQMVIIKDVIYAIGGYSNPDNMEIINIKNGTTWVQENMPFSAHHHCAVAISSKIVVIDSFVSNKTYHQKHLMI